MDLPGTNPDIDSFETKHKDRTMTGLSLAMTATQLDSTAHMDTFSGILEGLKIMCELMNEGFQQACLDVECIVEKTMEEATSHDWEFTQATTEDLDLWTAVLRLVLECKGVPVIKMEEW